VSEGALRAGWSRRRSFPGGEDGLLAAVLAVVALLQVLVFLPIASRPVGAFVALGSTVPLAWRRTHPVAATVAATLVWLVPTDGYVLVGYVAAFFLYYSVGAHVADLRVVAAVATFGLAVSVVATALAGAAVGEYAGAILAVVAPTGVGVLVRGQRRRARELEEIAGHLERERDQRARIAVAEERARIARELHDIVSHAVSLIAVQADAAEAALDHDPDLARRPLETVRASAREALDEMRRLLGVLRADGAGPEREPLPGLADVAALAEDAGATLAVEGEPRRLPQSADLAAFRIVQEALTNARKHAPGAPVSVLLRWRPDALEIDVRDRGPGPSGEPSADAHGLLGMRERVRLHGGELRAGAAEGGGFEVHAVLPLESP
jgi:signal transduction histidine kinase